MGRECQIPFTSRINALYDWRMQEDLKKRVPNRYALPRRAGLDGAS
jgi:hypothetical protein